MQGASPVALVAGAGRLPLAAAGLLRDGGTSVVTIGFEGLSDGLRDPVGLREAGVERVHWVRLGDLGGLERTLRRLDAKELLLVGAVPKRLLFDAAGVVAPDAEASRLLSGLEERGDDALLGALAGWLAARGFTLGDQATRLARLAAPAGPLGAAAPGAAALRDLAVGRPALRALGRIGIGQCVVVKAGTVLALEAVEGTDATIERAGRLGGAGATVIKAARPGQDRRIDLPVVGPGTIAAMVRAGASALAVEAGAVLVLDRAVVVAEAERHGIVLWGFDPEEEVGR